MINYIKQLKTYFIKVWLGVWFRNRTLDDIPKFTVEQIKEVLREDTLVTEVKNDQDKS